MTDTLRRTGYFNERHIDPRFRKGLVFAGLGAHPGSRVFRDSSGRHNHGTMQPDFATGPQWVWDAELGRWGLEFDGVDDYAVTSSFVLGNTCTLAAWVRTSTTDDHDVIMDKPPVGGGFTWALGNDETANIGRPVFYASGWRLSNSTVNDGRWHHLAVTCGSGSVAFYLDGKPDGNTAGSYSDSSSQAYIGHRSDFGFAGAFGGRITDPLSYSRTLSPAEIAWLADPTNRLVRGRESVAGRVAGNRRRRLLLCGRAA